MASSRNWTPAQHEAIRRIDGSVLVAAGAGSGKTAVLAERCAYLVADAPPAQRVDADRLLVVTFTEAAAGEMRHRIRAALRERAAARPRDVRLRRQAALIDAAAISTLHAFCLWLVRRWFHRVGVDAAAQLLDEDESRLLREDALEGLCDALYREDSTFGADFRQLVEDYGLGNDCEILRFVLRLAEFANSQRDPQAWLDAARDFSEARVEAELSALRAMLITELRRQAEHAATTAEYIAERLAGSAFYVEQVADVANRLDDWAHGLAAGEAWDAVVADIAAFKPSARGAPRKGKNTTAAEESGREEAKALFDEVRALLKKRVQDRLARFTWPEWREGIRRVAPYIRTLAELAGVFQQRYDTLKRGLGVMDFADLERNAYRLLTETLPGEVESPVAAEMRARFAYVLVDEYQDINPLQAAILNLVSRDGPDGNLFTVGDVKQSIYRFRLAEPRMFLDRAERLAQAGEGGCIDLQTNFRSRPAILDAVNLVFGRLMQPECGDIHYDEHAMLRPPEGTPFSGEPVELHVLEEIVNTSDEEQDDEAADACDQPEDEVRYVDLADPAQWRKVEREAFFVATHIRDLVASGFPIRDGEGGERPVTYRDICILLRSTKHSAATFAEMLSKLDVPAWTDAAGALFSAREVRETLALLAVLDNAQQDIPLAAVLRSGILGIALSDDELLEVRLLDRWAPFHEVVRRYAALPEPSPLRDMLAAILRRLEQYRTLLRTRPLAEALWTILHQTGYYAYVGGLAQGARRQANLVALHERARQFGEFRKQGLRRFLHLVETLQEQDEDLGAPAALGGGENAVRILSIHKSKGLEFPVVYVAELGRAFNLVDCRGRYLYDRAAGIAVRAVDRDQLIEYPTALHIRASQGVLEASLAEELRIWYVAMTRAKDRLILVGSGSLNKIGQRRAAASMYADRVPPLQVLTATRPLHWMVDALGGAPAGRVRWPGEGRARENLFRVHNYTADAIREWRLPDANTSSDAPLRRAVAELAPLPEGEPVSADSPEADAILARLDYAYPTLGTSSVRATRAASQAKLRYDPLSPAALTLAGEPPIAEIGGVRRPGRVRSVEDVETARRRGQVVHTALQFLRVEEAGSEAGIRRELDRLVEAGILRAEDLPFVEPSALAWFFDTEPGRRIRSAPQSYRREWMFVAARPVEVLEPNVVAGEGDLVLIRGVVDGILDTPEALELVDFKTDHTTAAGVMARAAEYRVQVELYTSAVAEIFRRPVRNAYLAFLHPRRMIELREINT